MRSTKPQNFWWQSSLPAVWMLERLSISINSWWRRETGGKAVLLVSLELDEVMDVSDRILVMYEGELVGQLDPKKVTVEELGLYMAGAKRDTVPAEV